MRHFAADSPRPAGPDSRWQPGPLPSTADLLSRTAINAVLQPLRAGTVLASSAPNAARALAGLPAKLIAGPAILAHLPGRTVRPAHDRKPDLHRARRSHLRRHDPNDGVRLIAEIHAPSQHVGIARKNALPQPVADDGHKRSAHPIFFFGEDPGQLRRESDHLEKVRRDEASADLLRRAAFEAAQIK